MPASRTASPSSPRKRGASGGFKGDLLKKVDAEQAQRTAQRLHEGRTSSYLAKRHDRLHQSESMQWGAERWGGGGSYNRPALFPPPL